MGQGGWSGMEPITLILAALAAGAAAGVLEGLKGEVKEKPDTASCMIS